MLRTVPRAAALLIAVSFFLLTAAFSVSAPTNPELEPVPGRYTDTKLYQDVAAQVASGQDYYAAATSLQRSHRFPTRPFFTVRQPTLAYLAAWFGWPALQSVLAAILVLCALVWLVQCRMLGVLERSAIVIAILAGGLAAASLKLVPTHEVWAGLLICLALALRGGPLWWLGVVAGAAAVAIRELAIPFVLLSLVFCLVERKRTEALAWGAVLVLFAVGMAEHARRVSAALLPDDPHSQGWSGLRGLGGALHDLADTSILALLPLPVAIGLALLALLGWFAAPLRQRLIAPAYLIGMSVMIALFARDQNFYWILLTLPTWFIGLAFAPRAILDLTHAIARPSPKAV